MTVLHLGDSGIVLNEVDAFGVDWGGTGEELPWSPSPAPRNETGANATDHGSWDATEFYGPRMYALEGEALSRDSAVLHQAQQRLTAAIGLRPFALRVVEDGYDRFAMFRRDSPLSWKEITPSWAIFSVSILAADPRAYSTAVNTASTGFPSSTGGLTLPLTVPLTIPATVTDGQLVLVNDGNEEAPVTYRIDGPVTNPGVVDMASGRSWRLNLTLAAGEWVTVDTGSHQVLSMGDVNGSRRNLWSGDWFGLAPGSNTLRFTGSAASTGALLTASWRDAWI